MTGAATAVKGIRFQLDFVLDSALILSKLLKYEDYYSLPSF